MLNSKLDVDHMTVVIFQVFNSHYMEIDMDPSVSMEKLLENLKMRTRILFEPWLKRSGQA